MLQFQKKRKLPISGGSFKAWSSAVYQYMCSFVCEKSNWFIRSSFTLHTPQQEPEARPGGEQLEQIKAPDCQPALDKTPTPLKGGRLITQLGNSGSLHCVSVGAVWLFHTLTSSSPCPEATEWPDDWQVRSNITNIQLQNKNVGWDLFFFYFLRQITFSYCF